MPPMSLMLPPAPHYSNENVDVIYICPFKLTAEVEKYYMKILELVEIEAPRKRFHIIVPENYVKFPEHLSLTQALLYSP